jgi:hypothetical protein
VTGIDHEELAPRAGLEPATNGLTVRRSTTELPGNRSLNGGGILEDGSPQVKVTHVETRGVSEG